MRQHHDIRVVALECKKKLTGVGREEFGFFSVLRACEHVRIMLARFDLTVLIGT